MAERDDAYAAVRAAFEDYSVLLFRGRPWPGDQPRHVARTTITATDADGLAAMRPPC